MRFAHLARFAAISVATLTLSLSTGCTSTDGAPSGAGAASGEGQSVDDVVGAKSDAEVKAEIEAAAADILYVSESDYPMTYVTAPLSAEQRGSITEALVRDKLASYVDGDEDLDGPLASLHAMEETFAEWRANYTQCDEDAYPGPAECAQMEKLDDALASNLRDVKVFYFGRSGEPGQVDGVAVSIFIVGRTPEGNLAGVRTVAIWT